MTQNVSKRHFTKKQTDKNDKKIKKKILKNKINIIKISVIIHIYYYFIFQFYVKGLKFSLLVKICYQLYFYFVFCFHIVLQLFHFTSLLSLSLHQSRYILKLHQTQLKSALESRKSKTFI